jgi:hypothetical protein
MLQQKCIRMGLDYKPFPESTMLTLQKKKYNKFLQVKQTKESSCVFFGIAQSFAIDCVQISL